MLRERFVPMSGGGGRACDHDVVYRLGHAPRLRERGDTNALRHAVVLAHKPRDVRKGLVPLQG